MISLRGAYAATTSRCVLATASTWGCERIARRGAPVGPSRRLVKTYPLGSAEVVGPQRRGCLPRLHNIAVHAPAEHTPSSPHRYISRSHPCASASSFASSIRPMALSPPLQRHPRMMPGRRSPTRRGRGRHARRWRRASAPRRLRTESRQREYRAGLRAGGAGWSSKAYGTAALPRTQRLPHSWTRRRRTARERRRLSR